MDFFDFLKLQRTIERSIIYSKNSFICIQHKQSWKWGVISCKYSKQSYIPIVYNQLMFDKNLFRLNNIITATASACYTDEAKHDSQKHRLYCDVIPVSKG